MADEAIVLIADTSLSVGDCLKQWQEVNLVNLRYSLDEQAYLIAEAREEYVGRRKDLASKVRNFVTTHVAGDAAEGSAVCDANNLIDAFKTEFDFLSKMCKLSEVSFLSLYKLLREVQPEVFLSVGDFRYLASGLVEYVSPFGNQSCLPTVASLAVLHHSEVAPLPS